MTSDNEIAQLIDDLVFLRELLVASKSIGPIWADRLKVGADTLRTENKRANKAEMNQIMGVWGKDEKDRAIHVSSYNSGRRQGWIDAVHHLEGYIGGELKREAMKDNPYE